MKKFSSAWAAHRTHHCVGSCFYCADERCEKHVPIPARTTRYHYKHPIEGRNRKQRRAGALAQLVRPF
jgi:hypothetical protein